MRDKTSIELLAEAAANNGVSVDDFHAYMPMHSYILRADARDVAGQQRQRPHPADSPAGQQEQWPRARGSTSTGRSSR